MNIKQIIIDLAKNYKINWKNDLARVKEMSPDLLFIYQYDGHNLGKRKMLLNLALIEYLKGNNSKGLKLYTKHFGDVAANEIKLKWSEINANTKMAFSNAIFNVELDAQKRLVGSGVNWALAKALNLEKIPVKIQKNGSRLEEVSILDGYSEDEIKFLDQLEKSVIQNLDVKKVLTEIFNSQPQEFGEGKFYQSMEDYGITGQRPTKGRSDIYQLHDYLHDKMVILDIGCNCGFYTLELAKFVEKAIGVEYNKSLVEVAKLTKILVQNTNAEFIQSDFKKVRLEHKFDFIFSFAVHHWVGMSIPDYAKKLKSMLTTSGYVLLESQKIETIDKDWDKKVKDFAGAGFEIVNEGAFCDDGVVNRKFVLFQSNS